jgi:hypothetical protein
VNQSEIEKLGIPTVTAVTNEFIPLAKSSMESIGLADMAFVIVPHPMGMIPKEEVRVKADKTFPDIMKAATQWKPERTKIPGLGASPYPLEVVKLKGTVQDVTKMFYSKNWSIGLPFTPPTTEAVQAMLKGTSHKPSEVVWDGIPPRMGVVTVELVAANGVMAGCKPEHMPLLLSVVEAMKVAGNWRALTTTTYPTAPLLIISGPVVNDLGIAYELGASGPEKPVNMCVGYFTNLVGDVAGGSRPPGGDMSTHGWVANTIATVVGENVDGNPWRESYAVEKGFKPTDNVVIYAGGPPPVAMNDHASIEPKDLANVMVGSMSGINSCMSGGGIWMMSPEHAITLTSKGWSKKQVKEYLWEKSGRPLWQQPPMIEGKCVTTSCCPPEEFIKKVGPLKPDTMIPVGPDPDSIQLMVVGGAGKQSLWWSLAWFTPNPPVIVKIDSWK